MTGTLKFFNSEKGWGFISPVDGSNDLFVHHTGLNQPVSEGDKVSFDVEDEPKGSKAVNVTLEQ